MTTLTVSDRSPSDVKADALVLATVRTDEGAALAPGHGLDRKVADVLGSALASLDAKGAVEEVHRVPARRRDRRAPGRARRPGRGARRTTRRTPRRSCAARPAPRSAR